MDIMEFGHVGGLRCCRVLNIYGWKCDRKRRTIRDYNSMVGRGRKVGTDISVKVCDFKGWSLSHCILLGYLVVDEVSLSSFIDQCIYLLLSTRT